MLLVVNLSIIATCFSPLVVKANIMCNDGTLSPSCGDCHRGCCSRHGGCSSNPNYSSNNNTYQPVEEKVYEKPKSSNKELTNIVVNGNEIKPVYNENNYILETNHADITATVSDEKA